MRGMVYDALESGDQGVMAIASPAEFLMAIERDGWATTGPHRS
jgi:hypothetical protein